jgi:hypothetical protein
MITRSSLCLWVCFFSLLLGIFLLCCIVIIDEVESLTAARAGAMAGTEPSDGLRVCCSSVISNHSPIAYAMNRSSTPS